MIHVNILTLSTATRCDTIQGQVALYPNVMTETVRDTHIVQGYHCNVRHDVNTNTSGIPYRCRLDQYIGRTLLNQQSSRKPFYSAVTNGNTMTSYPNTYTRVYHGRRRFVVLIIAVVSVVAAASDQNVILTIQRDTLRHDQSITWTETITITIQSNDTPMIGMGRGSHPILLVLPYVVIVCVEIIHVQNLTTGCTKITQDSMGRLMRR